MAWRGKGKQVHELKRNRFVCVCVCYACVVFKYGNLGFIRRSKSLDTGYFSHAYTFTILAVEKVGRCVSKGPKSPSRPLHIPMTGTLTARHLLTYAITFHSFLTPLLNICSLSQCNSSYMWRLSVETLHIPASYLSAQTTSISPLSPHSYTTLPVLMRAFNCFHSI